MRPNPQAIQQGLLVAAVALQKAAPMQWERFLQMLSASAELDNHELLSADPASILHKQGRALAMQELCMSLIDAEQKLPKSVNQTTTTTQRRVP